MSNNTLNAALRRLRYSKEQVSVSGFRWPLQRCSMKMGRWNPDAIERQLAHMEENDVGRAYMYAAEFWNERVEMMQVWAEYLDQLRHGSSADQGARSSASSQRWKGISPWSGDSAAGLRISWFQLLGDSSLRLLNVRLESACAASRTVGSNPTLSASLS
jgi:hypothetical protein